MYLEYKNLKDVYKNVCVRDKSVMILYAQDESILINFIVTNGKKKMKILKILNVIGM